MNYWILQDIEMIFVLFLHSESLISVFPFKCSLSCCFTFIFSAVLFIFILVYENRKCIIKDVVSNKYAVRLHILQIEKLGAWSRSPEPQTSPLPGCRGPLHYLLNKRRPGCGAGRTRKISLPKQVLNLQVKVEYS